MQSQLPVQHAEAFQPPPQMLEVTRASICEISQATAQGSIFQDYMTAHEGRHAHDATLIRKTVPTGGRILDIGCLPPVLARTLTALGYTVDGVDIDPARMDVSTLNADMNIARCNVELEPLPFGDDSFDAITLLEVFEHLRIDLSFTLSQIRRCLKPGGKLLVSTPNLRSIEGLQNFILKDQSYSCLPGLYPAYRAISEKGHAGHIREYTRAEMVSFLSDAGFQVREIVMRGRYNSNWKQVVSRIAPSLRPYCMYLAEKSEAST